MKQLYPAIITVKQLYPAIIKSRADNSANVRFQTRSPQYQWTYEIEIYSSYHPESKMRLCCRQTTLSTIDEICQLAIPKQIYTISMQIPSLMKIR